MKTPTQKEFWEDREIICPDTKEVAIGYKLYLKTKHWKTARINIFRRDNHKCQECGKSLDLPDANIHHKTYERVGKELDEDLILLCQDCHKAIHGIKTRKYTKKNWKDKSYNKKAIIKR